MRRALHLWLAVAALTMGVLPSWPLGAEEVRVKVVTHRARAAQLSAGDVRAIYLKQKLLWSDGRPIVAINREAGSRAREVFSLRVFGQDSRRLGGYWNQRYYEAGEFPPATLASEEAVMRFVASNENAIGYITSDTVADSVAVVLVLE